MHDENEKPRSDAEQDAMRDQVARGKTTAQPHPGDRSSAVLDSCREERETMSPHKTADCAGELMSEEYENEEDGGS